MLESNCALFALHFCINVDATSSNLISAVHVRQVAHHVEGAGAEPEADPPHAELLPVAGLIENAHMTSA